MKCRKCGSENMAVAPNKKNPSATDLYCKDCGAWQKFATRDEIRLYDNQKDEITLNNSLNKDGQFNTKSIEITNDELFKKLFPGCKYCNDRLANKNLHLDTYTRIYIMDFQLGMDNIDRVEDQEVIYKQNHFCRFCGSPLTEEAKSECLKKIKEVQMLYGC